MRFLSDGQLAELQAGAERREAEYRADLAQQLQSVQTIVAAGVSPTFCTLVETNVTAVAAEKVKSNGAYQT